MKLNFLILISMSICCNSQSQTKIFKNDLYHYEFEYPQDWIAKGDQHTSDIIAPEDHPKEKGREWISISTDATNGLSLDQCYTTYVTDWYKDQEKDFKIIAEGTVTLNGKKSKWIECRYVQGSVSVTHLVYLIFCDDRFFLITGKSSTKWYPNYKDKFEMVIKSFVVR